MAFEDVSTYGNFTDYDGYGIDPWYVNGGSEFHDATSVELGELIRVSLVDLMDKDIWKWPQYSDEQDETLRKKIVNRFYHRSIGITPFGLWKRQFIEKMNEIMPKYLRFYELLDTEPQLFSGASEYYKSRNIFSDFPQTQLSGNSDYASTGNDTEYERIRQLDILDLADRLNSYRDVDEMILDELEEMFSCLVSVSLNTR